MGGRSFVRTAAVCTVAAAFGAVDAQAASIGAYEWRPGVPGLFFSADPGEANDVRLIPSTDPSTTSVGIVNARTVTVEDRGATLRTSTPGQCQLLSAHKARCTSWSTFWAIFEVHLKDGADRVRMAPRASHPWTRIYSDDTGNRYTLRGPNTWMMGAGTGDIVRFLPPGGGGVIVGGSPRLWLADGAAESVECRTAGSPRIVSDPLDELGYYCTPAKL